MTPHNDPGAAARGETELISISADHLLAVKLRAAPPPLPVLSAPAHPHWYNYKWPFGTSAF